MAKFYGVVGFGETVETAPGVHQEQITEYPYFGDVIRNIRRLQDGEYLNKDIVVNNSISIMADEHAFQHMWHIRYVEWNGARWTVSAVEVQRPRLILSIGVLYNA